MATRRPNVPRATPAARKAATQACGRGPGGSRRRRRCYPGGPRRLPWRGRHDGPPSAGQLARGNPPHGAGPGRAAPSNRRRRRRRKTQHLHGKPEGKAPARPGRRQTPAAGHARSPAGDTGRQAARPHGGPPQPDESLDPVPAKAFSGRLLALGVVMIAITILLAPTVKIFLDKRAEIAALQADIAAKQAQAGGPQTPGVAVAGSELRQTAGPRPH